MALLLSLVALSSVNS